MERRLFIAATGTSLATLAGCTALGGDSDDDGDDSSDDHDSSEISRMYAVTKNVRETTGPIEPGSELLSDSLHDPDEPLRIEVSLTNTGDYDVLYHERRNALMWTAKADDTFILLPESAPESIYSFDSDTEYWVMDDGFLRTGDYQMAPLEPGETHTETLLLLVNFSERPPNNPPDSLAFDTAFSITFDPENRGPTLSSEWGFSLEREEDQYVIGDSGMDVDIPLSFEAELLQQDLVSSEQPSKLSVTLTNRGEEPLTFGERRAALFWLAESGDFVLYPATDISADLYEWDEDEELWIATDGFAMTMVYHIEDLEPEESTTEHLYVLFDSNEGEATNATSPEELTFEAPVGIETIDETPVSGVSATWRVTLSSEEGY